MRNETQGRESRDEGGSGGHGGSTRHVRRYTEVGGYRIHSLHAGTGPAVVLLHGLSGSSRWWRYTIPALSRRFRVHVPELVGFGRTRRVRRQPDISGMAETIRGWLAALALSRVHLVGHSMGGQIAVHLAAAHPGLLRTLTLVDASGVPHPLTLGEAARLVSSVLPPRAWGDPLFAPTIALDALRAGPNSVLRAGLSILSDDIRPLLASIRCPTLVVWGALDPLLPLRDGEAIAAGIAGSRLVAIDSAAHNPMADRPIEFNRVLLDFLDMHSNGEGGREREREGVE